MKTKTNIHVGDRVRFNARGETHEGTVTEEKFKRPGSRNALAKAYGLPTYTVRCLVVAVDAERVWTVAESHCERIGVGRTKDLIDARTQVAQLRSQIFEAEHKRRNENFEKIEASGLEELKRGDRIEVQFKGGYWSERRFMKRSGAGMIGYYREGDFKFDALGLTQELRVRFCAPEFVRIPMTKAVA